MRRNTVIQSDDTFDISQANTEPFYRFHRAKEELDRVLRAAVGALDFFVTRGSSDNGELTLLPTGGEPWGAESKWRTLAGVSSEAKKFFAQMGVIRVTSAFEDFLIASKAEFDRWAAIKSLPQVSRAGQDSSEGEGQVTAILTEMAITTTPISRALPLYEYFVLVRNCVAHRSGRASSALADYAVATKLTSAHDAWRSARGKKLPALPTVQIGEEIQVLPRHALMAGEVCYRMATHVNRELVALLGPEGMVHMAAYHGLLSSQRVRTHARNSPEAIINYILGCRYRVPNTSGTQGNTTTIGVLKRLGRWDNCKRAYARIQTAGAARPRQM